MDRILLAVGKARKGPETALFEHYRGRLPRGRGLTLVEVEDKRPLSVAERKAREAELLLACLPAGAVLVALDEGGRAWGSTDLAQALQAWEEAARPAVAFAIGGADGHGPALLDRADICLSLGAMTWPHMLVRALVAEQLYRAHCILSGHPYHRG